MTGFLRFGLRGIVVQCQRLTDEIKREVQKALFRNLMYDLFTRLRTTKKRVLAERQIEILKLFLDREVLSLPELLRETERFYSSLKNPRKALGRDLQYLLALEAIDHRGTEFRIRLEWPTYITETKFFATLDQLPRGKTFSFLSEG